MLALIGERIKVREQLLKARADYISGAGSTTLTLTKEILPSFLLFSLSFFKQDIKKTFFSFPFTLVFPPAVVPQ